MAQMRTLKRGRLYLLKDGSAFDDIASAAASSGGFFQKTDGSWGALIQHSTGDLHMYSGGTPASLQQASPAASINETGVAAKPVFYTAASRVHCWYATDEGSGAYDLRYSYTDNDGTSWATSVDLNIRGDQTWCTTAIWPVYFEYQGASASASWLWCVGNNAGTYTLGRVLVSHAGTFNTDLANAANYVAEGTSRLALSGAFLATITKCDGVYHLRTP